MYEVIGVLKSLTEAVTSMEVVAGVSESELTRGGYSGVMLLLRESMICCMSAIARRRESNTARRSHALTALLSQGVAKSKPEAT